MKTKEDRIENILKIMFENTLYPLKLPHYFNDAPEATYWAYDLGWKEAIMEFKKQYQKDSELYEESN